jgi:hypothetical protein
LLVGRGDRSKNGRPFSALIISQIGVGGEINPRKGDKSNLFGDKSGRESMWIAAA